MKVQQLFSAFVLSSLCFLVTGCAKPFLGPAYVTTPSRHASAASGTTSSRSMSRPRRGAGPASVTSTGANITPVLMAIRATGRKIRPSTAHPRGRKSR